jgi:hypothetical protein
MNHCYVLLAFEGPAWTLYLGYSANSLTGGAAGIGARFYVVIII